MHTSLPESKEVSVSVIVPVYNVYEWLDTCLDSIINQTFTDFEVLLINDGSTDGSFDKCHEWGKRDNRIKVISKKNGGPSIARNYGIEHAKGKYLVFIDADDWVDSTYLQKLYDAVTVGNASIAECDVYRFNNEAQEKTYRCCSGSMGLKYTLEEHMKYGYTAIWKCMIKRSLLIKYNIRFPDCHSEARAVYPLILAVSGKVENVNEGLYYYRKFRSGSLSESPRINNGDEDAIGLLAFDHLIRGFEVCGLYKQYERLLEEIIKYKLSDLLAGLFYRRSGEAYSCLAERYYRYVIEKFPNSDSFYYITVGGYNLNRILAHMNVLHNPYTRFNFSSVISLMHPIPKTVKLIHSNKYREIMIKRDIESSFWNIILHHPVKYIFMDFIEERFDILKYADGYITKSDALDGADIDLKQYQLLKRNSLECTKLWKDSVRKFIEKVNALIPECKVVIVQNYLSEEVGDAYQKEYFKNIDEIRNTNRILKQYYNWVSQHFKEVILIDFEACKFYYTDKKYEYGAIPSHLNEIANRQIAKKIEGVLNYDN